MDAHLDWGPGTMRKDDSMLYQCKNLEEEEKVEALAGRVHSIM